MCAEMLRQVMALTPEQIATLPPGQQAEIQKVKEHVKANNIIL